MKRITVRKGGLWYFITLFTRYGVKLVIKNVTDEATVSQYGLSYVVSEVYKAHNEVIGNL